MIDLLFIPIAILYLIVVGTLFIYGVNFFYLTYISWRESRLEISPPEIQVWPVVTVQLPVYNEMYVAERLIEAVANLDYPSNLLEIQVLDDSTDSTTEIIRNVVEKHKSKGIDIEHIHRMHRTGFKAGALKEGLTTAKGEFFCIFDADFIPPPDFLNRTLPYFYGQDPNDPRPIAFVQTRWGHVNREYSLITLLQSLAIDAHFMVEQFARSRGGFWFNFNGTGGVWRREAIVAAGGWKADTLTEDLDLSYRAFLNGWKGIYLREVEVPAELPVSFTAFRRQQHRWARGSVECAIKLIPQVWSAPIPISWKIEATLHLTGYGVHLLLFGLVVLYPLLILISQRYPLLISLFGIAIIFNATALAPTVFFVAAQHQLGRKWWRHFPLLLFISAAGSGMMVNTLRAFYQAIQGRSNVFERTPKFGIAHKGQDWTRRLYQLRMDPLVFPELALAALNAVTIGLGIYYRNYVIAFYAALFFSGLIFTSMVTIRQALAIRKRRVHSSNG